MGYDDRREILERLAALERRLDGERGEHRWEHDGERARREEDCGPPRHHHHRGARHDEHRGSDRGRGDHHHHGRERGERRRGRRDHDEKRIIDTIVHLVCEQMVRTLDDRDAARRDATDGGGEKRLVDLVVGLVAEHVREIVVEELDRRLGRPGSAERLPAPGDAPQD